MILFYSLYLIEYGYIAAGWVDRGRFFLIE